MRRKRERLRLRERDRRRRHGRRRSVRKAVGMRGLHGRKRRWLGRAGRRLREGEAAPAGRGLTGAAVWC